MTKNAIIIGATSGIGQALARLLSHEGYVVGITGRRVERLAQLRDELPGVSIGRVMDVAEVDTARARLEGLIAEMGGADLIVLNAGRGSIKPQLEWPNEARTIQVNAVGFAALADVAYHHFHEQGVGHLVGISSVAAVRGGGGHPAYNASKAFVSNYLQGLRHVVARSGLPIAITDIKPGFVDTAMAQGDGLFWVASPDKAARQIYNAIRGKKKHAYVTRRWRLVAWLLRVLPDWIVHRK